MVIDSGREPTIDSADAVMADELVKLEFSSLAVECEFGMGKVAVTFYLKNKIEYGVNL